MEEQKEVPEDRRRNVAEAPPKKPAEVIIMSKIEYDAPRLITLSALEEDATIGAYLGNCITGNTPSGTCFPGSLG